MIPADGRVPRRLRRKAAKLRRELSRKAPPRDPDVILIDDHPGGDHTALLETIRKANPPREEPTP